MKKICKMISLILVMLSVFMVTSFCIPLTWPVNYDGTYITVSGQIDEDDGKVVTLTMIKRDENNSDIPLKKEIYEMTAAELSNVYVKQTNVSNGGFTFKFIPTFANGIYDIYVNAEGMSNNAQTKVYSYLNFSYT